MCTAMTQVVQRRSVAAHRSCGGPAECGLFCVQVMQLVPQARALLSEAVACRKQCCRIAGSTVDAPATARKGVCVNRVRHEERHSSYKRAQ